MPVKQKEYPFYLKSTVILFGLVLLIYTFSVLGDILVPLAFTAFIAILLNPLCNRLQKKIPKVPAILLTLFIAIICFAGLLYFLSSQMVQFSESFPTR